MGIVTGNRNRKLDWIHGSPNDDAIQLTIAQTNPSGTTQRTTVTVTDAGTTDFTAAQLQELINRVHVFKASDNSFLGTGVHTNVVDYDDGAAADVIALVEFDDQVGAIVPASGDGHT